ncbi:MAG: hypothetical protein RBT33_03665 [Candidatus Dojkabacteria bacterium]|jgi:hypothetical protein|nr:hypothetical protein [Candidatus Dojkabacteria bacterium]
MDNELEKKNNFLTGVIITLATITIGLISYVFYTENTSLFREPNRCEYNGWAYADKETYTSIDGCNTCFCYDGETVCTEKACAPESTKYCDDGTVCPVEL